MLWTIWNDREHFFIDGWNIKWYSHFGSFLQNINIVLSYNPAMAHLAIYPKELKVYVHTKTCTWVFPATLFITVKT